MPVTPAKREPWPLPRCGTAAWVNAELGTEHAPDTIDDLAVRAVRQGVAWALEYILRELPDSHPAALRLKRGDRLEDKTLAAFGIVDAIQRNLDQELDFLAAEAKALGYSWEELGVSVDRTRQAMHKRYSKEVTYIIGRLRRVW